MGLDGGTYITRSDVLRGQSWKVAQQDSSRSTRGGSVSTNATQDEGLDAATKKSIAWSSCTISGQPLQEPIVADFLGSLYNKEAVLEFLLAKKEVFVQGETSLYNFLNLQTRNAASFAHLKTVKDVFVVHLHKQDSSQSSKVVDAQVSGFVCPVTFLPCEKYAFSALRPCGHVFSDRAISNMNDHTCCTCGTAFTSDDVIPLNGAEEQVKLLREKLGCRNAKGGSKSKKKSRTDCDAVREAETNGRQDKKRKSSASDAPV